MAKLSFVKDGQNYVSDVFSSGKVVQLSFQTSGNKVLFVETRLSASLPWKATKSQVIEHSLVVNIPFAGEGQEFRLSCIAEPTTAEIIPMKETGGGGGGGKQGAAIIFEKNDSATATTTPSVSPSADTVGLLYIVGPETGTKWQWITLEDDTTNPFTYSWLNIGTTDVDLSQYAKAEYATEEAVRDIVIDYTPDGE